MHVDAVAVGLPGHQLDEGLPGRPGGLAVGEVAQHGHAGRAGVVVEDVGADDTVVVEVFAGGLLAGRVVAGPAALVDTPLGVDQEVVTDVVPAVALHVVGVDRPHRGGRVGVLAFRGRDRVVHEQLGDRGVLLVVLADRLVGAPPGPGDDRRAGRPSPWASRVVVVDDRSSSSSWWTTVRRRQARGPRRRRTGGSRPRRRRPGRQWRGAGCAAPGACRWQRSRRCGRRPSPAPGRGWRPWPGSTRTGSDRRHRLRGRGRRAWPARAPRRGRGRPGGCRRRRPRSPPSERRGATAGRGCRPPAPGPDGTSGRRCGRHPGGGGHGGGHDGETRLGRPLGHADRRQDGETRHRGHRSRPDRHRQAARTKPRAHAITLSSRWWRK